MQGINLKKSNFCVCSLENKPRPKTPICYKQFGTFPFSPFNCRDCHQTPSGVARSSSELFPQEVSDQDDSGRANPGRRSILGLVWECLFLCSTSLILFSVVFRLQSFTEQHGFRLMWNCHVSLTADERSASNLARVSGVYWRRRAERAVWLLLSVLLWGASFIVFLLGLFLQRKLSLHHSQGPADKWGSLTSRNEANSTCTICSSLVFVLLSKAELKGAAE